MVTKDLGPVSAYALAVAHGFKGTEEEWAVLQAQAGANAQQVAKDRNAVAEDRQAVAQDRKAVEELVPTIKTSVDAWLDDHPEATTTVEDGAITEEKLNRELKLQIDQDEFVTPEMFGAAGDGVTDDTEAIRAALEASTHVRMGRRYLTTGSVTIKDNQRVTINALKYTGDDAAIIISGTGTNVDIRDLDSQWCGVRYYANGAMCIRHKLDYTRIIAYVGIEFADDGSDAVGCQEIEITGGVLLIRNITDDSDPRAAMPNGIGVHANPTYSDSDKAEGSAKHWVGEIHFRGGAIAQASSRYGKTISCRINGVCTGVSFDSVSFENNWRFIEITGNVESMYMGRVRFEHRIHSDDMPFRINGRVRWLDIDTNAAKPTDFAIDPPLNDEGKAEKVVIRLRGNVYTEGGHAIVGGVLYSNGAWGYDTTRNPDYMYSDNVVNTKYIPRMPGLVPAFINNQLGSGNTMTISTADAQLIHTGGNRILMYLAAGLKVVVGDDGGVQDTFTIASSGYYFLLPQKKGIATSRVINHGLAIVGPFDMPGE